MTKTKPMPIDINAISSTLAAQREALATLAEQTAQLEAALAAQLKQVRGTRHNIQPMTLAAPADSTAVLAAHVERLIRERPLRRQEIIDALPTELQQPNRVNGVLVRLQQNAGAVNLGNERVALWFIPDPATLKRLRIRR